MHARRLVFIVSVGMLSLIAICAFGQPKPKQPEAGVNFLMGLEELTWENHKSILAPMLEEYDTKIFGLRGMINMQRGTPRQQQAAMRLVGQMRAAKAVPDLMDRLTEKEIKNYGLSSGRPPAFDALLQIGQPAAAYAEAQLRYEDDADRRELLCAIVNLAYGRILTEALLKTMLEREKNPEVRNRLELALKLLSTSESPRTTPGEHLYEQERKVLQLGRRGGLPSSP